MEILWVLSDLLSVSRTNSLKEVSQNEDMDRETVSIDLRVERLVFS